MVLPGWAFSYERGTPVHGPISEAPRVAMKMGPLLSEEGKLKRFQGLSPESWVQILELTVLYVPSSLDCGTGVPHLQENAPP